MKNLTKLLLVALLSVTFFSCSDDDDQSTSSLKGLYKMVGLENIEVRVSPAELKNLLEDYLKKDYLGGSNEYTYFDGKGSAIDYDVETTSAGNLTFIPDDYFTYYVKDKKIYMGNLEDEDVSYENWGISIRKNGFGLNVNVVSDVHYILSSWEISNAIEESDLDIDPSTVVVSSVTYTMQYEKVSENQPQ